jgi:LPS export ABC transporter protein LptC
MTRWQRRIRLLIAVFGVIFAVFVAFQFRRRATSSDPTPAGRIAPGVVLESKGCTVARFTQSREDLSVDCARSVLYADGTSTLFGVKIGTNERNGSRTFEVTANEGRIGQKESSMALDGDVRLAASDGLTVKTGHATYATSDETVRAPGPVEFARNRMQGTGTGMIYEKTRDALTLLDQAVVHIAADEHGAGAAEVSSGTATFARRDKIVQFERNVRIQRGGQVIESDSAVAHLSPDEKRIETLDLRANARITAANAGVGGLQSLSGRDMNLKYAANGEVLERAVITETAMIQLAGEKGKPGRQIAARAIEITLAPDGSTPTALTGRDNVVLTMPAEPDVAERTIKSNALDAKGEPGRGLTHALFSGSVLYRERGAGVDRGATSAGLDVGLKPGLSSIEDARFSRNVRFEDGSMFALAAAARYDLEKGTLALSGSEPGALVPHVVNEQITVDAKNVDVTLAGPIVKATGNVKSQLQPAKKPGQKPGDGGNDVKMPSMLKQDQPVFVVADALDYDGARAKGVYTGSALLFQGDTTIKSPSIVIDDKSGDMTASGGVTTTSVLEGTGKAGSQQADKEPAKDGAKDKKADRTPSTATAKDFAYTDAERRLTYTGDVHMNGPDGDMKAAKIELYLKSSGDELERLEAYDALTLREQNRTTTGSRMTYTTVDEKYVVTGTPVTIVDQCERETTGKTLTFVKATDSIVIDGNQQIRTQTKGGGKCP